MRHGGAPETIPEGVPIQENWSRGQQEFTRGGGARGGGMLDRNVPMRKSQSFAGMQPVSTCLQSMFHYLCLRETSSVMLTVFFFMCFLSVCLS